jgi:hypothetical protein
MLYDTPSAILGASFRGVGNGVGVPVQMHGTSLELNRIEGPAALLSQRTPETHRVCGAPPDPCGEGMTSIGSRVIELSLNISRLHPIGAGSGSTAGLNCTKMDSGNRVVVLLNARYSSSSRRLFLLIGVPPAALLSCDSSSLLLATAVSRTLVQTVEGAPPSVCASSGNVASTKYAQFPPLWLPFLCQSDASVGASCLCFAPPKAIRGLLKFPHKAPVLLGPQPTPNPDGAPGGPGPLRKAWKSASSNDWSVAKSISAEFWWERGEATGRASEGSCQDPAGTEGLWQT